MKANWGVKDYYLLAGSWYSVLNKLVLFSNNEIYIVSAFSLFSWEAPSQANQVLQHCGQGLTPSYGSLTASIENSEAGPNHHTFAKMSQLADRGWPN